MNKVISKVLTEIQPEHDMDRVANSKSFKSYLGTRFFNTGKAFVRGSIVGALAGAFAASVQGGDVASYAEEGARLGSFADFLQINMRQTHYMMTHLDWYKSLKK